MYFFPRRFPVLQKIRVRRDGGGGYWLPPYSFRTNPWPFTAHTLGYNWRASIASRVFFNVNRVRDVSEGRRSPPLSVAVIFWNRVVSEFVTTVDCRDWDVIPLNRSVLNCSKTETTAVSINKVEDGNVRGARILWLICSSNFESNDTWTFRRPKWNPSLSAFHKVALWCGKGVRHEHLLT